jgi:hypothetical protein
MANTDERANPFTPAVAPVKKMLPLARGSIRRAVDKLYYEPIDLAA